MMRLRVTFHLKRPQEPRVMSSLRPGNHAAMESRDDRFVRLSSSYLER